jgi:hypothetical protein
LVDEQAACRQDWSVARDLSDDELEHGQFVFRRVAPDHGRSLWQLHAAFRDDAVPEDSVPDPLREVADRLRHDLRTRFADADVIYKVEDGNWLCGVIAGGAGWGMAGVGFTADDIWPRPDIESLVASTTESVVDNLWPDDLTDPWPACSAHRDHPLHPRVRGDVATWGCLRDGSVTVVIGALDRD